MSPGMRLPSSTENAYLQSRSEFTPGSRAYVTRKHLLLFSKDALRQHVSTGRDGECGPTVGEPGFGEMLIKSDI